MKNCGEIGISKALGENALFCRYTCESCGHDSQWRKVDVIKVFLDLKAKLLPRLSRQYFETDEEEIAAYYAAAGEEVLSAFSCIIQYAEQGYFEQLLYREKSCPVCGAKQSFMQKPGKRPKDFPKPRFCINPEVDGQRMLSDFVDPAQQEHLAQPCQVQIQRLSSFLGSLDSVSIALNGRPIGGLRIGTAITAKTELRHNILALHSVSGGPVLAAVSFEAQPGGTILRRFAGTKFK